MSSPGRRPIGPLLAAATAALLASCAVGASPAFAESSWWRLSSRTAPTFLRPGDKEDVLVLAASNLGDEEVRGSKEAIVLEATLPKGLTATAVSGTASFRGNEESKHEMKCSPLPVLRCEYTNNLPPYERLEMIVKVTVAEDAASGEESHLLVEGGQASSAAMSEPISVDDAPTPFGLEAGSFELTPEDEGGTPDSQAGSHPFQLTTYLDLNEALAPYPRGGTEVYEPSAPALAKDLYFSLPPGLIGNPNAVPQCSGLQFSTLLVGDTNLCPPDTAVGVASVTLNVPIPLGFTTEAVPVFNLVPAPGEPARFGFEVDNVPVVLDTAVTTGGNYGVVVSVRNASQAAQILGSVVTLWGVPGDPRHNSARGWPCVEGSVHAHQGESCTAPETPSSAPFLTLPTSCPVNAETHEPEGISATVAADSWLQPGRLLPGGMIDPSDPSWKTERSKGFAMEGCGALPFEPSINLESEAHTTNTPTGLTLDVHLPQQTTLEAEGKAEAAVRDTTLALPPGMALSPAAANGLEACSEAGVGYEQEEQSTGTQLFSSLLPSPFCPDASKIGLVHIRTPLLSHELEGGLYLADQNANPFGSLVAMYIVAEDPISHVLVKLAGEVTLNEETLQVVSTFKNTPQLPFEDLKVELFGGPRAGLTTPPSCGEYAATASFTPWSGAPPATPSSAPVSIGPCASPQPFAPGFTASSSNVQAGAFTPFSLEITRPDPDQAVKAITVRLPPGLSGMLSSVTQCPEPQASRGECGPESLVGYTVESAGLGPSPYTVGGGRVYITGPYGGAPFGLSIVAPAVAGPFNLGTVVVRSRIWVDPETAALTIASDPLPTQLKGIPLQLKRIQVFVDRPDFQLNPTSCNPMQVTGTITGDQGAVAGVSSPFQVGECQKLPFAPSLSASTTGHASKADGTSFDVKITSPGLGQANIRKVFLQLPEALPSRLETLQKACLYAVFVANPAACDEGSVIGHATVHTPLLRSALSGPAYLVSHGGAAFPDVEFVLQGEGVTLIVDGKTKIANGITYSRFEAAPDAPFTSFETELPVGPHSALTAYVPKTPFDLCGTRLQMPTEIVAQDGAAINQTTTIATTGCGGVDGYRATNAQLLAKALAACRSRYKHHAAKRTACEKLARQRFTTKKAVRRVAHKTTNHGRST